jgi:hypothetical protein
MTNAGQMIKIMTDSYCAANPSSGDEEMLCYDLAQPSDERPIIKSYPPLYRFSSPPYSFSCSTPEGVLGIRQRRETND